MSLTILSILNTYKLFKNIYKSFPLPFLVKFSSSKMINFQNHHSTQRKRVQHNVNILTDNMEISQNPWLLSYKIMEVYNLP